MSLKNLNMENENLTSSQEFKKKFFSNTDSFFSKKPKYVYSNLKDTTAILSSIASKPNFSQVRQRYKTQKFLSKFLLKSHMNWILYSFCRQNTLYIATKNHIGQSELNLQKLTILKYLKQSKDYSNIEKINIFRDDKKIKKVVEEKRILNFEEQSHGIFENHFTNKKLYDITQRIKDKILELKSNY